MANYAAAQAPNILGISPGMPYPQAQKIADGMYKGPQVRQWEHYTGALRNGMGWSLVWGVEDSSIEIATTQKGHIYFVSRQKGFSLATRPTWENFRKALVAQYGQPATESFYSQHYYLAWYFDSQWHSLGKDAVPPGCQPFPAFGSGGTNTAYWIPGEMRTGCAGSLWVDAHPQDTGQITFYHSTLLDEAAALRDLQDIQQITKQEEERQQRERNKVVPQF
jgi:hypothetical protein